MEEIKQLDLSLIRSLTNKENMIEFALWMNEHSARFAVINNNDNERIDWDNLNMFNLLSSHIGINAHRIISMDELSEIRNLDYPLKHLFSGFFDLNNFLK